MHFGTLTGLPSFCKMRANFRVPKLASTSFRAPVQTTLPDRNIRAVHRGSRIRIMTPWNRDGLYSEFRVRKLIFCKFKSQPKLTVATQFWILIEFNASCGSVASIGLCAIILQWGGSAEDVDCILCDGDGMSNEGDGCCGDCCTCCCSNINYTIK